MGRGGAAEAFDLLFAQIRPNFYAEGNILFYQGNEPLCLYFLCAGAVKLVRSESSGRQRIVRVISAPDIIGDRSLIAGQPYAATAIVKADARVCAIEAGRFWKYWGDNPQTAQIFARRLARRLGQADEIASDMALRTSRQRLAKHLLALHESAGGSGPALTLSESRQELAFLLGMAPEALSRELSHLVKRRLIAIEGRAIHMLDFARLRLVARVASRPLDFNQAPSCAASMRADCGL